MWLFIDADGFIQLDVRIDAEIVWLTLRQMAELFGISIDNVSPHLQNVYDNEELIEKATVDDYSVVQQEGRGSVRRSLWHYNLDAIIGVGYCVNSKRRTQFQI